MKDTSVIPKGEYCYTWIEVPSVSNNFVGKTKVCPYAKVKDINGVQIPWCSYLELGGYPGSGKWSGWEDSEKATEILNKHFGSEEETDRHLPLSLLFDGCKECGVNNDYDEHENEISWKINDHYNADPECDHRIVATSDDGFKCSKCTGVFCY